MRASFFSRPLLVCINSGHAESIEGCQMCQIAVTSSFKLYLLETASPLPRDAINNNISWLKFSQKGLDVERSLLAFNKDRMRLHTACMYSNN